MINRTGLVTIAGSIIIALLLVLFLTSSFGGCKTQAEYIENEPISCYNSRYLAREGINSDTLSNACADADKRDWCIRMLKDEKNPFRDFNDCWRTGK